MVDFEVYMELMKSEVRECMEYGTDWKGKQLIRDQMESKEKIGMKESENGIYEIDGANTTDGGFDIHGADEIDGTYENNRIGVFFIGVMENKIIDGIDATH